MKDEKCHVMLIDSKTSKDETHIDFVKENIIWQCNNTKIDDIQILDDNNIGKLSDLIQVLNICKKSNCKIINLSLGVIENKESKLQKELLNVCNELVMQNKIIIASQSNYNNEAVPANYRNVISVNSDLIQNDAFTIDHKANKLTFRNSDLIRKQNKINSLISGNSFLCGAVTGMCAEYLINNEKQISFFEYMEIGKYYFKGENKIYKIRNCDYMIFEEDNEWDYQMISILSNNGECQIKKSLDIETMKKEKTLVIGYINFPVKSSLKDELIEMIINNYSRCITILPIFSLGETLDIKKKSGMEISTIYL